MVLTVSEFRTTLEKTYRFSLPDHKSLIALMSKGGFQKFAEANGFPVPLSLTIGQAANQGSFKVDIPMHCKTGN